MPHAVNLDALIPREDFEVTAENPPLSALTTTLKVTDLTANSFTYQVLRKPDFQRETANWSPEKIAEFVQSYVDGDLIPAIIMWRAPDSGNLFVIDGAHRLSALIAWVHDDYGDKSLSMSFYDNVIPSEQKEAAERARKLIKQSIGSFGEIMMAGQHPQNSPPQHVLRARNLGAIAISLQWVLGDAKRAEASFFKINQKATPIDSTELEMIKSRSKPNAVAARALLRAGVGHKYWSAFPNQTQREIETAAREIYDTLFTPPLGTPIKTLDLPVAGRGYSAESVRLLFDFVNFANGLTTEKKRDALPSDETGVATLSFLKKVRGLASKISGSHASSLGLHPAVYFYGVTGRYQAPAFIATMQFIQELDEKKQFVKFTNDRASFEDFLVAHRYFTNMIIRKHGSGGTRSLEALGSLYRITLKGVTEKLTHAEIVKKLQSDPRLKFLREMTDEDRQYSKDFSRDTKSMAYLRDALEKALRCKICNARIHKNSITIDHIQRKAEGGTGDIDNAQLAHPYCNTGYKESQVANASKQHEEKRSS